MGRVAAKVNGPGALLEIGCTAGVELRFDRYHYRIGTASSGPSHAPVRIDVSGRGHERVRLGSLPVIAARAGMDLHPIDAADPVERRWLRALVWPENVRQAAQLTAALELVAADPPQIVTGDTTEGMRASPV